MFVRPALLLMALHAATSFPQYSPPRIEQYAPPILISHAPVPVYGPPGATQAPEPVFEGSFLSPESLPAGAPSPKVPASSVPFQGAIFSPAPIPVDRTPPLAPLNLLPITSIEEIGHIPENGNPMSRNEIVLPPGSRLSLTDNLGQFSHGFSDNGTVVSEQGRLLNTNDDWEAVIVKKGFYSYVSPEGIPIKVSYVADENGFRPTGDHLPS
ncbi:larval cuticle protein LCP-22-like [Periplaneta americana]|uniref:larval cuticle protein LCP-22-like n=1 Tax=Periplaneta americana TaxID=6978 RepID=UPI0037E96FA0